MESFIKVNLSNIVNNYKIIKTHSKKDVIAVIKDNAYGHGLIRVGQALAKENAFMLCVSSIQEAITLRKNLVFSPILLLGCHEEANILYSFKITVGVSSLSQLDTLIKSNYPLNIHLEIETGMNRLGICEIDLTRVLESISKSKLKLKGVFTHFCSEDYFNQEITFSKIVEKYFKTKGLVIHSQASNYLDFELPYCNAVRTGLSLFGYGKINGLLPSISIISPVIRTSKITKGEYVGYDKFEQASDDGYILTLPWGYSFGIARIDKISFTYKNKNYYQIGKMCMDNMMLYSSSIINEGEFMELNIDDQLINTQTIYYLISSLSPNIKRIYEND